jgi:hypothetical protein
MIQSESVSPQPAIAERSLQATDTARKCVFPVEVWYPEAAGGADALPLILFSHHSGEHSIPGAFKEHTRSGNLR